MARMSEGRALERDFPADPQMVQVVRRELEEYVRRHGLSAEAVEDLKVALSEAVSNAVAHGSPLGSLNRIHIRCEVDDSRVIVQITDQGGGFVPERIALPDSAEWKTSGRGLFLMKELVDDVQFDAVPGGTRVRLIKRFPRGGRGQRGPYRLPAGSLGPDRRASA